MIDTKLIYIDKYIKKLNKLAENKKNYMILKEIENCNDSSFEIDNDKETEIKKLKDFDITN